MIAVWLATTISIGIDEDAVLQAGEPLTVQLAIEDIRPAEIRLLDIDAGTIIARKRVTDLAPDQIRFVVPQTLRRGALELWLEGEQVLRVPTAINQWLSFAAPLEQPCEAQAAIGCDEPGSAQPGARLAGAELVGVNLARSDLRDAQFADANLTGADLSASVLSGANFEGADLSEANLNSADLTGARLYVSDPEGADLRSANLTGANLTNANLANADLLGANLQRAILTGVEFRGARCPDGTRAEKTCTQNLLFE